MIYGHSVKIKLSDEQRNQILAFIEKQKFKRRVLNRLPDGKFIDITDDPEYADIVKEISEKYKIDKL